VAVERDGSLLISDDGGKLIWQVSYKPESKPMS
jgi:glucose/arabinose dehydrogenase